MEAREAFLADVRYRLEQAQALHKKHYDRHHREVSYQVDDWVLLRLRQRAASSLRHSATGKLKPRYVGPYRVTEVVNPVAVRLQLPPGARLHDVFHIGVLKKFIGTPPTSPPALPPTLHGAVAPAPARVTRGRLARGVRQVLVQWHNEPAASATWEDYEDFRAQYPDFQLEDELIFDGGGDVMYGTTYRRRRDARRAADRAERARAERGPPSPSG
jgi:hypothetical protein